MASAGNILARNRCDGVADVAQQQYAIPAATNLGRCKPAPGFDPGYTGQAWLPELGMYHDKARIYSPTLGRFLQTDPIGYEDGMNVYAYVGNDPINGVDPTGLCGGGLADGSPVEVCAQRPQFSFGSRFPGPSLMAGDTERQDAWQLHLEITGQLDLPKPEQKDPVCSAPLTAPMNRGQTVSSRRALVRAEVARAVSLAARTSGDVLSAFSAEVGRNAARLRPGGSWIRGQATRADGNRLNGAITAELGVPLESVLLFGDIDEIIDDALGFIGLRPYDGSFGPDSPEAKRQIRQGA